jgi:FkbM family methyltransferase
MKFDRSAIQQAVNGWRLRRRNQLVERFGQRVFDLKPIQWWLGFRKAGPNVLAPLSSGLRLHYDFRSAIGQQLFYKGEFEKHEVHFFVELLRGRNAPIILDVGANIGVHALSWARALPGSTVYAVEPAPATADVLEANLGLNVTKNVVLLRTAVSDESGEATFYCCEDDAFSSLKDTKRRVVKAQLKVPVTTIDEIVRSIGVTRMDLIKIDVEGYESQVIKGAKETLTRFRPELFVEIYGGTGSNPDPSGTVELVRAMGFEPFVLVDGKPIPYQRHSDDFYNYYFRPRA